MDLFELVGTIAIKNGEANQALDETSQKGEKTQSKLGKAFSAVGKGAAVCGKAIMTGLAAGGAAMAGLTIKALNLSGELEQNMGGSEQVFGEYAAKMQETAKEAFSNMGLSTSDFLATANKMGALFQGAGFSIEESSGLASDAMQRAADVASIMGIDTSAAMEAIAGAAKGNFTMMDNLGVAMNDTTLNAYALEKGIKKSTSEMTNQEKIGLAMEMFMEKTAYAAGNYAKENQTLAGSLGTAKAALTNFLDGSGDVDQLVGAFKNAAEVIVKNVTEIAPRLISGITEIINKIIPMIPPLLNQLLPVIIEGAINLMFGLTDALPGIISALMAVLPDLIYGIVDFVTEGLLSSLPDIINAIVSALPGLIPILFDAIATIFVTLCNLLPDMIQPLIDNLPTILITIVNTLVDNLPYLINGAVSLVLGIVQALPQIIMSLVEAMPTVIMSLVRGLISAAPALIQGMKDIWTSVKNAVVNVAQGLTRTVTGWFGQLKDNSAGKFNQLKTSTANIFNGIKSTATSVWNGIKNAITTPIETAKNKVKGIVDSIKGFFSNMKLSLPKIKLPHFKVTGKLSISPPSVPKLSIEWYKKAMDEPYMFTEPTLFDYNPMTGTARGAGDAGDEVMIGKNTMLNMIRQAVAVENNAMVQKLERIISLLVQFFPEALVAMQTPMVLDPNGAAIAMAPAMNTELGKIAIKKGRGR